MNLDLDRRLALGFIFGIAGLTVELVGGLFGAPVSRDVVFALSGIVVATFGIQTFAAGRSASRQGKATSEDAEP